MSILKKIGLLTAKGCCFYPVSKDSAVLVGVKYKANNSVTIPERIGKYTVRGIDDPFSPGRIGDIFASLDEKSQFAIRKKLNDYQLLSKVSLSSLPSTVEYIGCSYWNRSSRYYMETLQIPSHVHYLRTLVIAAYVDTRIEIVFPSSLQYLGEVQAGTVSVEFCGPSCTTPPHLSLSDYLGKEMEGAPQIGNQAFAKCIKLYSVTLSKGQSRIGERAFAKTGLYSLDLVEGITHIGAGAFADCMSLGRINLPSSLTYLAPDAFKNCPQLGLTPTNREQLSRFPEAYQNMVEFWEKNVNAYIEAGNEYLYSKKLTIAKKKAAFEQYRRAIRMNPFNITAIYMLERLLLTSQVPNGDIIAKLPSLKAVLSEQGSLDILKYFNDTIDTLDNICVIISISDPEDIITQRHVYGLNRDQSAAASLLKFLLDAVQNHPKISGSALDEVFHITGLITYLSTRNNTPQSESQFLAQKRRHKKIFGKEMSSMDYQVGLSMNPDHLDRFDPICVLTSEHMMRHFRTALAKVNDGGFYDAEFWLELARTFNPGIQIPEEFTNMQSRCRKREEAAEWRARMRSIVFPAIPILPMPRYSYRDEDTFRMDELTSEYWSRVAAEKDAEWVNDMWRDLNASGFWDDKSWQ